MEYKEILESADLAGQAAEKALQRAEQIEAENKSLLERIESLEADASGFAGGSYGKRTDRKADAERKAFSQYLRTLDPSGLNLKTISTSTPSAGAMVPEVIASDIDKFAYDSSEMQQIVRVSNVSAGYTRFVRVTPAAIGRVGETGNRNATDDPSFREVTFTAGEMYAHVRVTNWMLEDAFFDLAGFVSEEASEQFARAIDLDVILGNGTNQATGVLDSSPVTTADTASPLRDRDTIQYVAAPSPDSLADHLMDTYFTLHPTYRRNATWVMNSNSLAQIRKLKASSSGEFLWHPNLSAGVDAGNGGLLLGHPVRLNENMPNMGESPLNFPIIVGDWRRAYEVVFIGRPRFILDEVTSIGTTGLYFARRVGGRLAVNDALKAMQR